MSIHIYQRPAEGTSHLADIGPLFPDWHDSNRAIGGFWQADGSNRSMSPRDMAYFFGAYLGCRVKRLFGGLTAWEGLIYEMRLLRDGQEYTCSLDPEWFANGWKIFYTDNFGAAQVVAWAANTDSQAVYGERWAVDSPAGSMTAAAAAAKQLRLLRERGWPRTRDTGGLTVAGAPDAGVARPADGLSISCAGLWATLNWRLYGVATTDTASNLINTLAGAAQFVTPGRIEANSLGAFIDGSGTSPVGLGDAIQRITEQGDVSGNVWQCGVYEDGRLVYEPAPSTVTYWRRDGRLVNGAGLPVRPEMLQAGCLVMDAAAPVSRQPSSSTSPWDDQRVSYVDTVEYDAAANAAKLSFFGQEESTLVLQAQAEMAGQMWNAQRAAAAAVKAAQDAQHAADARAMANDARKKNNGWVNRWYRKQGQPEPYDPGSAYYVPDDARE